MSIAPSYVAIKRRRDEHPLSALVLEERQAKYRREHVEYRLQSTSTTQPALSHSGVPHIHTTQPTQPQPARPTEHVANDTIDAHRVQKPDTASASEAICALPPKQNEAKRTFSLAPPLAGRKRGADVSDELPTFIESKRLRTLKGASKRQTHITSPQKPVERAQAPPQQKRAGAGIAKRSANGVTVVEPKHATAEDPPSKALSDALHAFALEELAKEEQVENIKPELRPAAFTSGVKPAIKFQPKPAPRLRDRVAHTAPPEPNVRIQDEDTNMDDLDDEDYVYDIYIRHSTSPSTVSEPNVSGVLVITEQDEPLWQTYLEDSDGADDRFDTDDEDENAEGYYGADYPEDEVASDDELGAGAYRYRRGDSDDEQWDREAWSDGDDEIGEPWRRMPWIHAPGGAGPRNDRDDDDDDDDDEM